MLVRVLGPIDILGPEPPDIPARGDRTRAILTLLALRPSGVSAAELVDLAWPHHGRNDQIPMDAVYEAQRRVRTLLAAAADPTPTATNQARENARGYLLLDNATSRYRLDPDQITTDLNLRARLEDQAEHTNAPDQRLHLLQQAAALYRGPLADGLDDNERDWLTTARYQALVHAAHLHLRVAELTIDTDPRTALDHVKQAAALAPDDEHTRTEAIRLYQQLGRDDLARALMWRSDPASGS
jgi:DNA-binding SARP family transcriptional activator